MTHSLKLPDEERTVKWKRHPHKQNTVVSTNEHGETRECRFINIHFTNAFLQGQASRELPLVRFDEYAPARRGRKANVENKERDERMRKVRERRKKYASM